MSTSELYKSDPDQIEVLAAIAQIYLVATRFQRAAYDRVEQQQKITRTRWYISIARSVKNGGRRITLRR